MAAQVSGTPDGVCSAGGTDGTGGYHGHCRLIPLLPDAAPEQMECRAAGASSASKATG